MNLRRNHGKLNLEYNLNVQTYAHTGKQVKSHQSVRWNEGKCRLCVSNKSLALSWSEAAGSHVTPL